MYFRLLNSLFFTNQTHSIMRLFTLVLFSLFLMAQATPVLASVESVPASGSSYASYVEGIKHNKGKFSSHSKKERLFKFNKKKARGGETDNEGIVGAILALVLGGLGIHRVYLGSDGIIILWYILTIFGLFGIIPLIDFFRLLLQGSSHYKGNNNLFACFQ